MAARKTVKRRMIDTVVPIKPVRRRMHDTAQAASSYFANIGEKTDLMFISSGCALMDAALGGGYVLGRTVNLVGDKSAGKTLQAIEICANFHNAYPKGYIRYKEVEAAFDERYAAALGMPVQAIDFKGKPSKDNAPTNTVEAWYEDIMRVMDENPKRPILYILDSLDALSDEAEAKRDIDDASYGGNKAKKISEMFRRISERMERQQVLLVVISQLRDKLGVTFGEKQGRMGGRALDFYASHVVWLAELGKIRRTIDKIDRVVGVKVKARVRKNKVGLPFRDCEYPIIFGYGIDDLTANAEWLIDVGKAELLKDVDMSVAGYALRIRNLRDKGGAEAQDVRAKLRAIVFKEWQRIEMDFLPKAAKY